MSESDLVSRVRDVHRVCYDMSARELDIQLKWICDDDDDDNDGDANGLAMGECKDEIASQDASVEKRRPGKRVAMVMKGDPDWATFTRYASGFVCFHGPDADHILSNVPPSSLSRQYIDELVIHTMLPSPFLPLFKLPSLQSLHYLCLTMDPMLLMTAAPYLPPTLVTLQVTSVARARYPDDDNEGVDFQMFLPSDLAQRLHHCQQLRHFIVTQRLNGPFARRHPCKGSTPLASLYVLEGLSETLPGLETIQWNVAINPTRLWLEYEGMCNNDEVNAKAKVDAAAASASASSPSSYSNSSSSSSITAASISSHAIRRRPPPRVRHVSSLLLGGSGRLPWSSVITNMGTAGGSPHDAQIEFDFFKMMNRPQWREQNKDRWILNGHKQKAQDVEAVTSVLAWFGENVRHIRMDVDGELSLIDVLATRWPDSIRSSISDLSVICLQPAAQFDHLPLLTNMQLTSIRRVAFQFGNRTRMSDEPIRQVLDAMPHLTDLTIQCAPTFLLDAPPKLPSLTCLTVPLRVKHVEKSTLKDRLLQLAPNLTSLRITGAASAGESDEVVVECVSLFHSALPSLCSLQWRHLPPLHPNEVDAFLSRRREMGRQREEKAEAAVKATRERAEQQMKEMKEQEIKLSKLCVAEK